MAAPSNPELVIRDVVPGTIVTFSKPFKRLGVSPIGGRTTAIKLSDGSVWLLASTPLDTETKSRLDALGPVQHIAVVNAEHTMYTKEYAAAYPEARIVGPEGSRSRTGLDQVTELTPESRLDQIWKGTVTEEIEAEYFAGFTNKDIAFYHHPTKSLIQGDLLFNLPANEQYSKSTQPRTVFGLSRILNMKPGTCSHKWMVYTVLAKDRLSMARSVSRVNSWDFERIIPCHGDVIETGAKAAWESTYEFYISGIKSGKLPTHDKSN